MRILLLFACLLCAAPGVSSAAELKPFKDALFAYPGVLSQVDSGTLVTVDYQEMRDINARDEVPERRVQGK